MTSPSLWRWGTALLFAISNGCATTEPAVEICNAPASPIHEVQGPGRSSPRAGERVVVQGVVVGDFQEREQLSGFFLQASSTSDLPATASQGLFIHAPDADDVRVGDLVRVSGRVKEYGGLTELTAVESISVCESGKDVTPRLLSLSTKDLEPFEGMLVAIEEELTVVNTHELEAEGQFLVAAGGRPFNAVGAERSADKRRLLIDDGSHRKAPEPTPYLDAVGTLRIGNTLRGLRGVISEANGSHVLHPTTPPRFTGSNSRTDSPPEVGGTLKVVAFNVLNFFLTPGERGAQNEAEFERQRTKIVNAIEALDADVVGLIELENDGDRSLSHLVEALDEASSSDWDFVRAPAAALGEDVIRLGFIYRPDAVQPVGQARADLDPTYKRPPLAQTFEAEGERFTVIVNHFKSKGCGTAEGIEKDQRDGQGCWNALRTRQAKRILDFVQELQASSGDPDVLVIGDLNAYGGEDPIRALSDGGLIDQIATHVAAEKRYSYVYRGTSGYLDHAFATPSLAERVTGAAIWHINSDEPELLDYRLDNPEGLYRPDPFRSSDHDPVLVGLDF